MAVVSGPGKLAVGVASVLRLCISAVTFAFPCRPFLPRRKDLQRI